MWVKRQYEFLRLALAASGTLWQPLAACQGHLPHAWETWNISSRLGANTAEISMPAANVFMPVPIRGKGGPSPESSITLWVALRAMKGADLPSQLSPFYPRPGPSSRHVSDCHFVQWYLFNKDHSLRIVFLLFEYFENAFFILNLSQ